MESHSTGKHIETSISTTATTTKSATVTLIATLSCPPWTTMALASRGLTSATGTPSLSAMSSTVSVSVECSKESLLIFFPKIITLESKRFEPILRTKDYRDLQAFHIPSDMIPTPLAMALAVIGWSPVTMMTLIPALRHLLTASGTAARGGSIIDIKPTKHKSSRGKLGG